MLRAALFIGLMVLALIVSLFVSNIAYGGTVEPPPYDPISSDAQVFYACLAEKMIELGREPSQQELDAIAFRCVAETSIEIGIEFLSNE